jgi:hypothetical protein
MKYAIEMGPGAVTYIPSFVMIGSAIKKINKGYIQTQGQHGDFISLL